MAGVTVLVGAQWGDEGKGKWIDVLAKESEIIARYQGGNNAGHTLYVDGEKVVLHQLPSGIFHGKKTSALAAGVVINPVQLVEEIEGTRPRTQVSPERLWLSARAHVITPWHIQLDHQRESQDDNPIGTTKRGIGPTYAEKAARTGLRLGQFVNPKARGRWLERMKKANEAFADFATRHPEEWDAFEEAAAKLEPYVCDAEARLREAARQNQRLLLEGAQGILLDLDHGTYPYVTSSGTGTGGACQSLGLKPTLVNRIIGIAKAYLTRVGEGPFPTELHDDVGRKMADRGNEFGASTGRPRRCGWLDLVALRYAVDCCGLDGLVLNKMDILDGFPEVKVATSYEHPEFGTLRTMPWDADVLAECTPNYETLAGWPDEVPTTGKLSDLPDPARAFLEKIEAEIGVPILMAGTGPGPEDALYR